MKERIKKVRKKLDLTQQEFGDRLGVKRNTIATYEAGKSTPSDAAVSLICREFNINEAWLRTGEGEMFVQLSKDAEIAAFVGKMLSGETATFKKRLISVLASLDESDWVVLENKLKEIVGAPHDE